jgi:hypothetical protein
MSKTCKKCGESFGSRVRINGEEKNISGRVYCLSCSPWGKHNTINLSKHSDTERTCSKCGKLKPISEYPRKNGKRYHSWCKDCLYGFNQKRWEITKKKAVDYKGGCCNICGYDKCLAALEFHHIDPTTKEKSCYNLMLMSWDRVKNEIDKCVLLCSNCHREKHNL